MCVRLFIQSKINIYPGYLITRKRPHTKSGWKDKQEANESSPLTGGRYREGRVQWGIKVRGLAAIRNFPKSRSEAKGGAGRRTQSNRPSWWLGEGQAHPQRMVDLTVLWEGGGLVCRGGEKFKWVVKCEGIRGHLKVRVYGLRSRALSSRELGWVREHGLEPGEKAAEKKLAAALSLCRICDLLFWAVWAWSKGH